jgi:flagellum-specific ATP synthase
MELLDFNYINKKIKESDFYSYEGVVKKVIGLTIEVEGIKAFIGEVCTIYNQQNNPIECEVVGFVEDNVILMPLGELIGIAPGCRVVPSKNPLNVKCSEKLFGKVLDGLGRPLNGEKNRRWSSLSIG